MPHKAVYSASGLVFVHDRGTGPNEVRHVLRPQRVTQLEAFLRSQDVGIPHAVLPLDPLIHGIPGTPQKLALSTQEHLPYSRHM